MKIKDFFGIVGGVLLDWRVIVTLVLMLFVMGAANFILKYQKKAKKPKKEKPAPAPKQEEKKEEKSEEDSE